MMRFEVAVHHGRTSYATGVSNEEGTSFSGYEGPIMALETIG